MIRIQVMVDQAEAAEAELLNLQHIKQLEPLV
jgi:hypothetical protein